MIVVVVMMGVCMCVNFVDAQVLIECNVMPRPYRKLTSLVGDLM